MASKLKGNKSIAYVLVGAGTIALAGTAFGAWILSQQEPDTTSPITVVTGEVKDYSMKIDAVDVDNEPPLRFDAATSDTSGLIQYGSEDGGGEQLSFGLSFQITNAVKNAAFADHYGGFKLSMTVKTDGEDTTTGSYLNDAISSSYLVLPVSNSTDSPTEFAKADTPLNAAGTSSSTFNKKAVTDHDGGVTGYVAANADGSTLDVNLTLSFGWGSFFGYGNPGDYDGNSESASVAMSALSLLEKASNAKFTITVTPYLAAGY